MGGGRPSRHQDGRTCGGIRGPLPAGGKNRCGDRPYRGFPTPGRAARPGGMRIWWPGGVGPNPNPWTLHPAFPHIGGALRTRFREDPRAEHDGQVVRNASNYIVLAGFTLWGILHFGRALPILYTCKELGDPTSGKCSGAPFAHGSAHSKASLHRPPGAAANSGSGPLPGIAGPMRTLAATTPISSACLISRGCTQRPDSRNIRRSHESDHRGRSPAQCRAPDMPF